MNSWNITLITIWFFGMLYDSFTKTGLGIFLSFIASICLGIFYLIIRT